MVRENSNEEYKEDITLVIPTHERHQYLIRILEYYNSQFCNWMIIVCDSSKNKFEDIKKFKNVKYFHYPYKEFCAKVAKAVEKVKSEYCVFCADDDFITPSAIKQCIHFLKSSTDYASAQGRYTTFKRTKYGIELNLNYFQRRNLDINCEAVVKRLEKGFSEYMHTFYSVHKTDCFKKAYRIAQYSKINNTNLLEIFIAFVSLIYGKHKVLPVFYCAREVNETPANVDRIQFKDIMSNSDYAQEYNNYIDTLALLIVEVEKVNFLEAREYILKGINAYINRKRVKSDLQNQNKYKIILKNLSPNLLIDFLSTKITIFKFLSKTIKATRREEGYPFFDRSAINEWKKIEYYIKKYYYINQV